MVRVRFAPSPTGFLHVGSARTFIFNWLYARHQGGTMVLRVDDTDVERNTEASLTSIFEGLRWLDLGWDEEYKQSERLALHRQMAEAIFQKGLAYRDFTPARTEESENAAMPGSTAGWLCNPGMRELSREESDRRAAAGEAFRVALPRAARCRAANSLRRCRLRRAGEVGGRHRRFRLAAQRRHADLSSGIVRRRRRPAHQPHHSRPGSSLEHLQAPADLRGRRGCAAAVRASAFAGCARWNQAFQAPPRTGGERDHLPRRGISARGVREFSLPARLVAEERPRADEPAGTGRRLLA